MRTTEEIVDRMRAQQADDFFGWTAEVLVPYLPANEAREFCKADADLSDWEPLPRDDESVRSEMAAYMSFAWNKVLNHRGVSASRSVEKMSVWLWLLGDDETLAFAEDESNFQNYGAPILKRICERHGFPMIEDEGVRRMAEGKPCCVGCKAGCGT